MVEILNGKRSSDALDGWVIAQTNGLTLVGRRMGDTLSPVYEMKPQIVPHQGQAMAIHPCVPVWLFGVNSVTLPSGALVVKVDALSRQDRTELAASVEQAAQMSRGKRARESGIAVVKTMPNIKEPGS